MGAGLRNSFVKRNNVNFGFSFISFQEKDLVMFGTLISLIY